MTFPTLSVNEVFNITEFQPNDEGLTAAITRLEAITAPGHDATEHKFNDPEGRGICTTCGWVHPNVPADCKCGRSLKEHLAAKLRNLKAIRDLHTQAIDIDELIIVLTLTSVLGRLESQIDELVESATPRRKKRR